MRISSYLKHPIIHAGIALLIFRMIGVAHRYLIQGGSLNAIKLQVFMSAVLYNFGIIFLIVAFLMVVRKAFNKFGVVVSVFTLLAIPVMMLFGQIDFSLSSITGGQLTPTVFRTYRGPHLLISKEFLDPVKEHWIPISIMTTLLLTLSSFAVRSFWKLRKQKDEGAYFWKQVVVIGLAGFVFYSLPKITHIKKSSPPVEVAFLKEYMGMDNISLDVSEDDAMAELRDFVGLPEGARWASDEYPLVYIPDQTKNGPAPSKKEQPDIIVLMMESLRGQEMGFVYDGSSPSKTPNIDAMAKKSVVFPLFIANGFPTAPSVMSFHCSVWPHYQKEIMTDFSDRNYEILPLRLQDFGYDTRFVGGNISFDNQDKMITKWYQQMILLTDDNTRGSDRNIFKLATRVINEHDEKSSDNPLYTYISTFDTHYPFTRPFDIEEPEPEGVENSDQLKYDRTIRYTDRELKKFFDFLNKRKRKDNTVVVFLGDHSFYVNLNKTTGLPVNDTVWTSAFFYGPEKYLGPPRVDHSAVSIVDIMPTLLDIVGDKRPTASLGTAIFGKPRNGRNMAIAIRRGGMRMDVDGQSLIIDSRNPNDPKIVQGFPEIWPDKPVDNKVFSKADVERLYERIIYWSYIIEEDRIWNDSFLKGDL